MAWCISILPPMTPCGSLWGKVERRYLQVRITTSMAYLDSESQYTVYTLWKRPLLPTLSTPRAAVEKIAGGADLMIPGVSTISDPTAQLPAESLVGISAYGSNVPIAVGRLVIPLQDLVAILEKDEDVKGKAVHVLHVYGDSLWASGSKRSPPDVLPSLGDSQEQTQPPVQELTTLNVTESVNDAEVTEAGAETAIEVGSAVGITQEGEAEHATVTSFADSTCRDGCKYQPRSAPVH